MKIIEPTVQGRKSLNSKIYVDRSIEAYLMVDLEFGERYCVPFEEDTLGKSIPTEHGHTVIYAFKDGVCIVLYRDYFKDDYGYLDFHIKCNPNDVGSPESYSAFLMRTIEEYQIAFLGSEEEIRHFGNAPKIFTISERIIKWFKSLRKEVRRI